MKGLTLLFFLVAVGVSLGGAPPPVGGAPEVTSSGSPSVRADWPTIEQLRANPALASLSFSYSASFGDAEMAQLPPLKDLKQLRLAGTQITDRAMDVVARFEGLELLDLTKTRITSAGIARLKGLTRLRSLFISGSAADDTALPSIGALRELRILYLSENMSSAALKDLARLDNLEELVVPAGIDDAALAALRPLRRLRCISSLEKATDAGMRDLGQLTALESIDLSYSKVGDDGLSHLQNMTAVTTLLLERTAVTDGGLTNLKPLRNLAVLNLRNTAITDRGLAEIKALPALTMLDLNGTKVTDAGLAAIAEVRTLESLDLSWTQVTGAGLAKLAKLPRLHTLMLDGIRIADSDLKGIVATLPRLEGLSLEKTPIADSGMRVLAGLQSLGWLDVVGTVVSAQCAEDFRQTGQEKPVVICRAEPRPGVILGPQPPLTPATPDAEIKAAPPETDDSGAAKIIRDRCGWNAAGCGRLTDYQKRTTYVYVGSVTLTAEQLAKNPELKPVLLRLRHVTTFKASGKDVRPLLEVAKSWPSLSELDLTGDFDDDNLVGIGDLKAPESVVIRDAPHVTDGAFKHIGKLKGVSALAICDAPNVTDGALQHIGKLKDLRSLSINKIAIRGAGFRYLAGLKYFTCLNVTGDPFGDEGLKHLEDTKLQTLELRDTLVTDAGLAHLAKMTTLRQLLIDGARVTDAGFAHLSGLTRLESLSFDRTRIGSAGLRHLAAIRSLRSIIAGQTDITDAGLVWLSRLPSLEYLDLYNDRVTEAGLAYLAGCARLHKLDLVNAAVTDLGVRHMVSMRSLGYEDIRLDGTDVGEGWTLLWRRFAPPGSRNPVEASREQQNEHVPPIAP